MRPVLPFSHGPASVAALVLVLCTVLPAQSIEAEERATVFLVRHAEKASHGPDPELTDAGALRARALASLLRDAGDTAAPLASQLDLDVTIYDPSKLGDLAADIERRGGRCLVVGHSNTTPELVGLLGGEPGAPIDEQSEHDRLYVLTIAPNGTVGTVVLRYGR
jgi:broad specificity phosphatase PhoE